METGIERIDSYKQIDEKTLDELLRIEIEEDNRKIVVLDDDPTGIQTIHDLTVYTDWSRESIRDGFHGENKLFFLLTNSRSFTEEQTVRVHREIAAAVNEVSKETGIDYILMNRSDSTLRGHFPLETAVLRAEIEKNSDKKIDGEIICPFFKEGGRFTMNNVHYVRYGDVLVPANETEFAKDKTFGYTSRTLPEYVEEKTMGEFRKEDVVCISLEDIRNMDIGKITEQLMAVHDFNKVIVNAVDYPDIKVFCIALYRAMKAGKNFLFRTAASMIKVICGNPDQPLLTRAQMVTRESDQGGVIIVGSHTAKTTAQVERLRTMENIEFVELDARLVRDAEAFEREVSRCLAIEEKYLRAGKTVCCYTTRELITADTGNKEDDLRLSVKISDAVQSLVGKLSVTPAFVIAKGGITSSDIGTRALAVKKAYVLGQIQPGVPVWLTGHESTFPGTPYVIFPGNVGEEETLKAAVEVLMAKKKPLIAVTIGDPAGIGPEIVVKTIADPRAFAEANCIVLGDAKIIKQAIEVTGVDLKINCVERPDEGDYSEGVLNLIDSDNIDMEKFEYGKVSAMCGKAAFDYIQKSIEITMNGEADAVATAPINKEALRAAGIDYIGHTEIFAALTGTSDPLTMFETNGMRVFFLTRHVSLRDMLDMITKERIIDYVERCTEALRRLGVTEGTMAVAGLNPHSGEHGLFGWEEVNEIAPAVEELQARGFDVKGPVPADSVFHQAALGKYNSVLSLYHDQGHIATKTLDFDRTIAITNSMPILRTSVDHGTAFDIAGKGIAGEVSMIEAVRLAARYAPYFTK